MSDVAHVVIDDLYGRSYSRTQDMDRLLQYFDYEAYGRDLNIEGYYIPAAGGYICLY